MIKLKKYFLMSLVVIIISGCNEDSSKDSSNISIIGESSNESSNQNNLVEEMPSNQPPIAQAGRDQNVILGSTVTLNASESYDINGHIVNYLWSENGVKLSNQKSFNKSNFSIGKHTITLQVTDNDDNKDTDIIIIMVNEKKEIVNTNFNLDVKYDRVGTNCNNDRYCDISIYKVKIDGNKWKTTTKIESPYIAKKGEVIFIGFGNNFTKPTLLNFSHNIPKNDIIDNTLSLSSKDRPSKQWIVFKINQNINFNMKITREIETILSTCCYDLTYTEDRKKVTTKLYQLDDNFEKDNLLQSRGWYDIQSYNTSKDYSKNLLVECLANGSLLYNGIIHITNDEFWNFKNKASPNWGYYGAYKVSYLTDLYFYGYKKFINDGLSHSEAKEKANTKVKDVFNDYSLPYVGETNYKKPNSHYIIDNDVSNSLYNQFDFIRYVYKQNGDYIDNRYIVNTIAEYLFNGEDINDYFKVNFFPNKLQLLSKNNHFMDDTAWLKGDLINSSVATGDLYIDNKNILNITLTSNRQRNDKGSVLALTQEIDIDSLDKSNLYFRAVLEQAYGKEEEGPLGMNDCSGIAGITLAYLDVSNNPVGYTTIANMDDSIALGLKFIANSAQTIESTDTRHIIRIYSTNKFRAIVLNIKDEIKNISNINSIEEISKIKMILFTGDHFTEGDVYYRGMRVQKPECRDAKAYLKVSEAGIYKVID